MSGIGVVTNPRSSKNRRNPALAKRLGYILGERDVAAAPADLDGLAATVARFREREVDVVCINGGDGTVHTVVTALARAWEPERPLPRIALLRGGTMNTQAHGLGIKGSPEALLGRVVDAYHSGEPLPVARRSLLCVDGEQYGFIFGNGLIAQFLEPYYEGRDPSPLKAAWLLARAVASALWQGPFIRRIMRPWRGVVTMDGRVFPEAEYLTVTAGTIDDIGLGFRPFYECLRHPEHMHAHGFRGSAWALSRQLPRIYRAQPMTTDEVDSGVCRELVLRSAAPIAYMLDGDFHQGGEEVRVRTDRAVEFVLPP